MKTNLFGNSGLGLLSLLCALSLGGFTGSAPAQAQVPRITSIRPERADIVVTVQAPAGLRRLTLESRERFGPGAWEPRVVQRLDGAGGTVTLRLARSRVLELLRVRGDDSEPLPAAFFQGTNTFAGEPAGGDGSKTLDGYAGTANGQDPASPPAESTREVAESDIWKIRGQTLYFFNQYRGLQIIDITEPDTATVRGTLDLPASGEQMYLLGSGHVVLLARNGCYYSQGEESRVVVVADQSGSPAVTAQLAVSGYITESRMVGSVLYVASQAYRQVADAASGSSTWEWGTRLTSFDLADPAAPVKRDSLWYPGYGHNVAATDRFFFVITQDASNWRRSLVYVVDISAPDGAMRALGSISPSGNVQDKFKVNLSGEVLTLISQVQTTNLLTTLETFSLANPAAPKLLGSLSLGLSEQLHATRFDGNRVYVVTFHVEWRMDPLWIVDLSDPARPRITGELEIPGWSTYLEPLGGRLVALGIETNRTTVSLFDVADPAKPALLSRVALGGGWSWSEANNDEKAFKVLPDSNLILVPFNSWTTNGSVLQVQLIDLLPQSVAARGVIEHKVQPRRATLCQERILSISGRELLSVEAADRDHPVVRGAIELSWPVDRVVAHGDFLVELSLGSSSGDYYWWNWYGQQEAQPVIRVVSAAAPDRSLTTLPLSPLPVLGVAAREDRLYVLQGRGGSYYPWVILNAETGSTTNEPANPYPLLLTVFDLNALPQLVPLGQTEAATSAPIWGSDLTALWPKPGLLVWASSGGYWGRYYPLAGDVGITRAASGIAAPNCYGCGWPWGSGQNRLFAFDVRDPAAPAWASEASTNPTNAYSFSQTFAAEGQVYFSHATSEFVPGLDTPWKTYGYTNIYVDSTTGLWVTNITPAGSWVERYFLDVIDYADAAAPTLRQPVSISGTLQGISHRGALLYTTRTHYQKAAAASGYTWAYLLDALAYDGVAAHWVDSMALSNYWSTPLVVAGTKVYLSQTGYDNATYYPSYLETWLVAETGKFTRLSQTKLNGPAYSLRALNDLLIAQENDNSIALFDLANPGKPGLLSEAKPPTCYWIDLAHAEGDKLRGLWVPMSGYGVTHIPIGVK